MKTRRTPWWQYVIGAALGVLAGMGLAKYGEISGLPLVGAPWIVPVVLAVLGGVVLYMALQIHKYTTKDPVKRAQLKPSTRRRRSARWCCKALGLAGATFAGWYGGQIIMSLPHGEAEFYSQAIIECVVARGMRRRHDRRHCGGVAVPHPAYRRAGKSGREKGRTAQSLCDRRHEGVYKIGYESCHEIESLNVRPSLTPSQSFFGTRNIASCAMQATSSPSCV